MRRAGLRAHWLDALVGVLAMMGKTYAKKKRLSWRPKLSTAFRKLKVQYKAKKASAQETDA